MALANREAVFKWADRKRKEIDLGGGMSLLVQQLNVGDLLKINDENNPLNKTALGVAYLVRSAINEDGTPMFTEADVPELETKFSAGKIADLLRELREFNSDTEKAQAENLKN